MVLKVLILLVFAGFIVFALWYGPRARRRRTAAMTKTAAGLDFTYRGDQDPAQHPVFGSLEPFRVGRDQKAEHTMNGTVDIDGISCQAQMGDYCTIAGSIRTKLPITFSYVVVRLPWTTLPGLSIRPENIYDQMAGPLGYQDIEFESTEFNRHFRITGEDRKFAVDLIDARMMKFLTATNPGEVIIGNGHLFVGSGIVRWDPPMFATVLTWVTTFVARWPRHVKQELRQSA